MKLSANDYSGRSRHPVWERELAHTLRKMPESGAAFNSSSIFCSVNLIVAALNPAHRCLSELEEFLNFSLTAG